MIFLLDYDPRRGKIIGLWQFREDERLRAEYTQPELERDLAKRGELLRKILLLEAPDFDTLKASHKRYFRKSATVPASGSDV